MASKSEDYQAYVDKLVDDSKPGSLIKAAIYTLSNSPKNLGSTSNFKPENKELDLIYKIFTDGSSITDTRVISVENTSYTITGDVNAHTTTLSALISDAKDGLRLTFLAKKAADVMMLGIATQLDEAAPDRFAEVAREIDFASRRKNL